MGRSEQYLRQHSGDTEELESPVDFPPVADPNHQDGEPLNLDPIDDAVVPHADPVEPPLPCERLGSRGARTVSKSIDPLLNLLLDESGQLGELA